MRKILNFICAITFLIYSSVGFADTTKKHLGIHPPIDLTVINAGCDVIFVNIIGTNVEKVVHGGSYEHIHYSSDIEPQIILRESNYHPFFTYTVCPLAIITVRGGPGSHNIVVDPELCS